MRKKENWGSISQLETTTGWDNLSIFKNYCCRYNLKLLNGSLAMRTNTVLQSPARTESLSLIKSNAKEAAQLLKAMANDSRLLIICHLNDQELSVSELNRSINLSQSALSQHLAVLRKDGLVTTRRKAQTIYYSLKGESAKQIIGTLHGLFEDDQPMEMCATH